MRRQQRQDPALRYMKAAVHSIDKAFAGSRDHAARQALGEARSALSACLPFVGMARAGESGTMIPRPPRATGPSAAPVEDTLLAYIPSNPSQRGERIAQALGTDIHSMRPVMRGPIQAGRVRIEGRSRAMSYAAA